MTHCNKSQKGCHRKRQRLIFGFFEKCLGRLESKGGNYEKVNFTFILALAFSLKPYRHHRWL